MREREKRYLFQAGVRREIQWRQFKDGGARVRRQKRFQVGARELNSSSFVSQYV